MKWSKLFILLLLQSLLLFSLDSASPHKPAIYVSWGVGAA